MELVGVISLLIKSPRTLNPIPTMARNALAAAWLRLLARLGPEGPVGCRGLGFRVLDLGIYTV